MCQNDVTMIIYIKQQALLGNKKKFKGVGMRTLTTSLIHKLSNFRVYRSCLNCIYVVT